MEVSFQPHGSSLFTPGGRAPWYPFTWMLGGPHNQSGHTVKQNSCFCWELNPRFSSQEPSQYTGCAVPGAREGGQVDKDRKITNEDSILSVCYASGNK